MVGKRITGAAKLLVTGNSALQEKIDTLNIRNNELKKKYQDQTALLNEKLEVVRAQVQAKDKALSALNDRIAILSEKLKTARDMVQQKDQTIKKIAQKS